MSFAKIVFNFFATSLFAFCVISLVFATAPYERAPTSRIFDVFVWFSSFVFASIWVLPVKARPTYHFPKTFWFWVLVVFLTIPFAVLRNAFAINRIDAILIFLRDHNVNDAVQFGLETVSFPLMLALIIGLFGIYTAKMLLARKRFFNWALIGSSFALLAASPVTQWIYETSFPSEFKENFDIEGNIVAPDIVSTPEVQPNLVFIYLESIERTYQFLPETKQEMQRLTNRANSSIEADNIQQVLGADITIAGIVASHCGVPFLTQTSNYKTFQKTSDNSVDSFMPEIWCLGDQLAQDGYTLSYMNGASLQKFSKGSFLKQHGYTRLVGKETLDDDGVNYSANVWGADDAYIFEAAKEELKVLASSNKPFVFSMLTTATHNPNGFLDSLCRPTPNAQSNIPRAIECTGKKVDELIEFTRKLPNTENTIFVIMSDHLSYPNAHTKALKKLPNGRRNYFALDDGTGSRKIQRAATTLDVYPTLLETLGYTLKDGKANLGVSLFSQTKNMAEEHGQSKLNELFRNNNRMADFLWR